GLYGAVDGNCLVIAGCSATAVIVVGLFDRLPGVLVNAFVLAVELPEGFWGREFVQAQGSFCLAEEPGAVVEQEAVAITAEHERGVQGIAVSQGLLHAIAQAVVVVLGFDDGNGHVLLVAENVIRPAAFAASVQPAAHDDAASGERDLFPHLAVHVPACVLQGRVDVLRADVPLCELFLVHALAAVTSRLQPSGFAWFCGFRLAHIGRLQKVCVVDHSRRLLSCYCYRYFPYRSGERMDRQADKETELCPTSYTLPVATALPKGFCRRYCTPPKRFPSHRIIFLVVTRALI